MSVRRRKYYVPTNISSHIMYHEDWVDFNKNGVRDPFENPKLPVERRIEDLLKKMTLRRHR